MLSLDSGQLIGKLLLSEGFIGSSLLCSDSGGFCVIFLLEGLSSLLFLEFILEFFSFQSQNFFESRFFFRRGSRFILFYFIFKLFLVLDRIKRGDSWTSGLCLFRRSLSWLD